MSLIATRFTSPSEYINSSAHLHFCNDSRLRNLILFLSEQVAGYGVRLKLAAQSVVFPDPDLYDGQK